jgi:type IV secretion system protein TrbL
LRKDLNMRKILLTLALLAVAGFAQADAYVPPTDLVGTALQASSAAITNNLLAIAVKLLFVFLVLQFTIDGLAMLGNDATIDKVIGKLSMSVLWATFCLYLLEPGESGGTMIGDFMQGTVDQFLGLAASWVGASGGSFDTWDILSIGLVSYGKITIAVAKATATSPGTAAAMALIPGLGFVTALMVFFTSIVILVCCAYIALKVFLVKVQAALFIAVAPLSVAMLGLKGLRDQGIAPFKMLLGLVYRIVILAAIVTSLQIVAESFTNFIDGESFSVVADIWTPILGSMFGFVLLAFLTHHADGIAASLASGNVALGSGDLAGSVAAGVAAGMAAGAAGAALNQVTGAAGTGKAGQAMSDWLKKNGMGMSGQDSTKSDLTNGVIKPGATVPATQAVAPGGADLLDGNAAGKGQSTAAMGENQDGGESRFSPQEKQDFQDKLKAAAGGGVQPNNPASYNPQAELQKEARNKDRKERQDAIAASKAAASTGAATSGQNAIGGKGTAFDEIKQRLEKHADSLNREVRHDEGQDMGIHVDGYHRD